MVSTRTRVANPKDKKFTSLLNWLLKEEDLEVIFKVRVFANNYTIHQTKGKKIILSSDKLFMLTANDFDDLLRHLSILHDKTISKTDVVVVNTEVINNEKDLGYEMVKRGDKMVAQVEPEFFPKRFSKRSGIMAYGKTFYVVKKSPDGIASKYTYQVYSWASRLLLYSHEDKDMCEAWINFMYSEVQHLDTV